MDLRLEACEIQEAIIHMKEGISPDCDGLSIYVKYWRTNYCYLLKESFQKGLPSSLKKVLFLN